MNGYGSLKRVTQPERLHRHLLPRVKRVVSNKGIRFKKHHYVGADEETRHLLNRLNQKNKISIEFCYNPTDITEAYLYFNEEYYPLQLCVKEAYRYKNLEVTEMDFINRCDQEDKHTDRVKQGFEWSELKDTVSGIVQEAQRKTPAHSRKDLENLRGNRKEYIELEKREQRTQREAEAKENQNKQRESFSEERRKFLKEQERLRKEKKDD